MTIQAKPTCLHEPGAPNVKAEPQYSVLGGVMLVLGITAEPKTVRFRCRLCHRVFDETADRAVCRKYVAA